jgi:hypothetical protein
MRGADERTGELFSYVDLEERVPAKHPLRLVRRVVNEVLAALDSDFSKAYADSGRPSIAPVRLGLLPPARSLILLVPAAVRSQHQTRALQTLDSQRCPPNYVSRRRWDRSDFGETAICTAPSNRA